MNAVSTRGMSGFPRIQPPTQPPNGAVLADSYRQDAMNNFQKEKPQYNPVGSNVGLDAPLFMLTVRPVER
jgi:hypothetical protein